MKDIKYTLWGIAFGILLTKADLISWFRIRNMFLFKEAHLYLVIFSAIATAALAVFLIRHFKMKTLAGQEIVIEKKALNKGTVIGGAMFGVGWAATGACAGPIFAQIGAGEWGAIMTLTGAVFGAYSYSVTKSRLPH
ncbi:MAG: transporter [Deltaproteobacteria bacterium HGW-Deltaproteobacteria-12]|jgi:hypothetical protein|nr:MAG: transporter [Deltaproteobacteria bacterium HGW-Deltaproteobacteria-12]